MLYFEVADTKQLVRILTDSDVRLSKDMPVFIRAWDELERTVIEYLDDRLILGHLNGWKYSRWYSHTANECVVALSATQTKVPQ